MGRTTSLSSSPSPPRSLWFYTVSWRRSSPATLDTIVKLVSGDNVVDIKICPREDKQQPRGPDPPASASTSTTRDHPPLPSPRNYSSEHCNAEIMLIYSANRRTKYHLRTGSYCNVRGNPSLSSLVALSIGRGNVISVWYLPLVGGGETVEGDLCAGYFQSVCSGEMLECVTNQVLCSRKS